MVDIVMDPDPDPADGPLSLTWDASGHTVLVVNPNSNAPELLSAATDLGLTGPEQQRLRAALDGRS
ncbi:hypothetical protein RIF23_05250 [Lipingzhangella sp. LS1_29]|uniref:Uncharacterized protein n=1 Tax=Lipingzhangella rawalii TaxID=2055835 RepID=A0ABU2H316_9ACTN|nr:hypothetical protein [Lipingzhangella rawalii]MDS1269696.1 hypothetical protein [Lipingzhangella rawalii]